MNFSRIKSPKKSKNASIATDKINLNGVNKRFLSFANEIKKNGDFVLEGKSVEELENIRVELINHSQFMLAEVVSLQQEKQQEIEDMREAAEYSAYFSFLVQQAEITYEEHLESIHEKYQIAELKLRKQVSEQFHNLQIAHISALVESEKEYIVRNTKRTMRAPKKARDLVDQANQTAKIGDYLAAQDLIDLATEIDIHARIEAKNEISREFMHVRKAMIKGQKTEITELSDKLASRLAMMYQQLKEEIIRLNVAFVKELGIAQTAAKKNVQDSAKTIASRDRALQLISEEYRNIIENLNLESE